MAEPCTDGAWLEHRNTDFRYGDQNRVFNVTVPTTRWELWKQQSGW